MHSAAPPHIATRRRKPRNFVRKRDAQRVWRAIVWLRTRRDSWCTDDVQYVPRTRAANGILRTHCGP
jgi:hypothetical protein